jgi:hypothetical protein
VGEECQKTVCFTVVNCQGGCGYDVNPEGGARIFPVLATLMTAPTQLTRMTVL